MEMNSELHSVQDKKKEKKSKKKEKTEEASDDAGESKPEPKKAAKAPSNVFALFNQGQIQEFKEVSGSCSSPCMSAVRVVLGMSFLMLVRLLTEQ